MRWEKAAGKAFTDEEARLLADAQEHVERAVKAGHRLALRRADGSWFLAVSAKGRELRGVEFNLKGKAE